MEKKQYLPKMTSICGIPVIRGVLDPGSPPKDPNPDSGSTIGGHAVVPPVHDDPMDTSGFGGSGSDLSLVDNEVNRLFEEEEKLGKAL